MRFLALSPAAAYALLAAVALIIALLHLLKPPPQKLVVPSALLWVRAIRHRKRRVTRRLIALLLALAAGLSLALALTRPEIPAIAPAVERLTLILDNSASMAARTQDGRSRWEHALARARALLERSGAASEVVLADTRGRLDPSSVMDRDAALAALRRVPGPAWGEARMPTASQWARAQAHLFTDGVAPLDLPAGAIVHPVFEPADNVAVTAFEARPLAQDPTRYEALVQVLNASAGEQRVRLLITGGARFSIAQDLDLRAGEMVNASFDISGFEGGVLAAAAICRADAFALDDLAYALVPPHRATRVLLVTPGNPALADALRSLPGVRLGVVPPEGYARAPAHDAVVFDRFAPAEPPAAGALLLRPPARKWLGAEPVRLAAPRITGWNETHAVNAGIAWRNLRLARASASAPNVPAEALVQAGAPTSGALVSAGEARARWISVGFALHESNFALQPDFPVFLGNALRWVGEPSPVLMRSPGSVEVALRDAQVHDGSGAAVPAWPTAAGIVFDAPRVDVYTVSGAGKQVQVVASLPDPGAALINRSRLGGGDTPAFAPGATARLWNAELWMLLALLAGALLLVEWTVFTRRGAV